MEAKLAPPAPPRSETLELQPASRLDIIDVRRRLAEDRGEDLLAFPRALYVSYHTTAGYPDERLTQRLEHSPGRLQKFLRAFRSIFPPEADYHHDRLHLRTELSEEQRCVEPRNADSHLTFIGAGLNGCVTYEQADGRPVWFVDLDGVNGDERRTRRTTVVGYHREEAVTRTRLEVPISGHAIDSVNLKDPRLGLFEELEELVAAHAVEKGRLDLRLDPGERYAGLTVNEYETLLMNHDLAEVLRDPFRYVREKGRSMIRNPRAIPGKTLSYATYDVVRVLNEVMDALGLSESLVERILHKLMSVPAARFLRMKRRVSLAVIDGEGDDGRIVQGRYQSPILVQWRKSDAHLREVEVELVRFR